MIYLCNTYDYLLNCYQSFFSSGKQLNHIDLKSHTSDIQWIYVIPEGLLTLSNRMYQKYSRLR